MRQYRTPRAVLLTAVLLSPLYGCAEQITSKTTYLPPSKIDAYANLRQREPGWIAEAMCEYFAGLFTKLSCDRVTGEEELILEICSGGHDLAATVKDARTGARIDFVTARGVGVHGAFFASAFDEIAQHLFISSQRGALAQWRTSRGAVAGTPLAPLSTTPPIAAPPVRTSPIETTAPASFDPGRYHALIIGNQAYRHLRSLDTPIADATAVADLLRSGHGFVSVKLLTNANRDDMVLAFDELRRQLEPTDNLLVYYAGHGWLDRDADRGYWLSVDAAPDSRARWLSNADITDTVRALKAKHVLVVADSCYSGTLTRSIGVTPLAPPDILRLSQKRARTALVSGGLEPVADVGAGTHSVFAKAFLDALRGNQGVADLASLFGAIRRQVLLNAPQTPEYTDIRQAGHDGGDFLFVRRR